jgi:hypothetical protein
MCVFVLASLSVYAGYTGGAQEADVTGKQNR